MVGIYKITNPKGFVYIGRSTDIARRLRDYKKLRCKNQHKLYASLSKYGFSNHFFEIIWLCNEYELSYFERKFQLKYNCIGRCGLNLCLTEDDDHKRSVADETKIKIKNALKGRSLSEEHKLKISKANSGKKKSDSHREKMKISKSTNPTRSKVVVNLETKEEFKSLKDAAKYYNLSYTNLVNKLSGYQKNKTNLIYKNDLP